MPEPDTGKIKTDSSISARITKITGVIVALTALVTAVVHFRDSIPWLTPVAKIQMTPAEATLDIGEKVQISAVPQDSGGKALAKKPNWGSANPGVVTVEGDGIVTAGESAGGTTITAAVGPVKGITQIHVRRATVARVDVFPQAKVMEVDQHLKLDATPYDSEDNPLPGRTVRWSSENDVVATVSETSGEAVGKSPGNVKLTAQSEDKLSSASVTVNSKAVPASEAPQAASTPSGASIPSKGAASARVRGEKAAPKETGIGRPGAMRMAKGEAIGPSVLAVRPQLTVSGAAHARSLTTAQQVTIVGGIKTGACPASVRILVGETLIELKTDPQIVPTIPGGDQTYSLHGTVACRGQVMAVADGQGTVNIASQRRYRCRWQLKGVKHWAISLQPE
jgi:hypothetical protein